MLPCFFFLVPLAIAGYVAVRNVFAAQRYCDWLCYSCGNELKGKPPVGVCSNCGRPYRVGAILTWPVRAPMGAYRWLAIALVPLIGTPLTFWPWIASNQGSDEFGHLVCAAGFLLPLGIMAMGCCRTVRPGALWTIAGLGVLLPCVMVYAVQFQRDASIFGDNWLVYAFSSWIIGPFLAAVFGWVAIGEPPRWWATAPRVPPSLKPIGATPPTHPGIPGD